jgi:hypothetical protein
MRKEGLLGYKRGSEGGSGSEEKKARIKFSL